MNKHIHQFPFFRSQSQPVSPALASGIMVRKTYSPSFARQRLQNAGFSTKTMVQKPE